MGFKISRRDITVFLTVALVFSFLAKLFLGTALVNTYDTYWYRTWAEDLPNGLFDVYSRADEISLDYPPVYLFFLYLTGLAYRLIGGVDCHYYINMLFMKFWPILFDLLTSILLYRIFRNSGEEKGILASFLWTLNPSVFVNTVFWGQTDQMMCFLLILSFWFLYTDRTKTASVIFAVAGLTKFQSLFFLPVFLLFLFEKCGIVKSKLSKDSLKRLAVSLLWAVITVVAVFMPFSIGAKDPFLFFKVYLGSYGEYPYCTFNAFNLYGLLGLNGVEETTAGIFGLSFGHISGVFVLLSLILLVYLFFKGKRRDPFALSLLFMNCLFMLMTKMHERYQLVILPFALIAYIIHSDRRFLHIFSVASVITAINQFVVLTDAIATRSPWKAVFDGVSLWDGNYHIIMTVVSALNLVLFFYIIYVVSVFTLTENTNKTEEEI